ARRYRLILIEDATEALGTRYTAGPYAGQYAGTIGDIGCYSFNGNKIITTGAGGMLVSNHADWAEHAKHLSTQAKADLLQFKHDEVGYNYRMTNVQASLGLAQLSRLEAFITVKEARYTQYKAALDGQRGLRILPFREEADGVRSNRWFYSLAVDEAGLVRDSVIDALQAKGIQTRPIWALVHEQADYGRNEAYDLDKALAYRKTIVNLPCSTNLSEADCRRVIDAVLEL
ncbi:MAG: DegT/DnrJ/EryC1/StrS family aminotransferase, partial [Gemmiger sp.]